MAILETLYDPARAAVVLTVDGGMWPSAVTHITMTRTPLGGATVEVRGLVQRRVEGGWYIGSDHEMPLDTDVEYTVTGYSSLGAEVATETSTVSTVGASWGLWLKAAGQGDLTLLAQLRDRGESSSATIGGTYQVHGGPEVAQWSGVAGERITLTLQTRTAAADAALTRLLTTTRVLLIQSGQPSEFGDVSGSGWWFVQNKAQGNPSRTRSDVYAVRQHTLQLVATTVPAGDGVLSTGQTYSTVYGNFATYQAIVDDVPTYGDLLTGAY